MKILIKPGQVVQVSIYNVLFLNADNINESHHLLGSIYFCFITNLCSLVFSLGLQNRIKCLLLSLLEQPLLSPHGIRIALSEPFPSLGFSY